MKYVEKVEIKRRAYKSLWTVPFIAFVIGYFVSDYFLHKSDVLTPNVIGKSLDEAALLLSGQSLGVRVLTTREDVSLPEGVVLDQIPSPLQKIKTNQNVFITLSTHREAYKMPDYWGKKHKEVIEDLKKNGLETVVVYVSSDYPQTMCIAQYPCVGCPVNDKKVLIYISDGKQKLGIMPKLVGLSLRAVQEGYKRCDVRVEVFHMTPLPSNHDCSQCVIVDQMPPTGAIVDTSKGMRIQLQVVSS